MILPPLIQTLAEVFHELDENLLFYLTKTSHLNFSYVPLLHAFTTCPTVDMT